MLNPLEAYIRSPRTRVAYAELHSTLSFAHAVLSLYSFAYLRERITEEEVSLVMDKLMMRRVFDRQVDECLRQWMQKGKRMGSWCPRPLYT